MNVGRTDLSAAARARLEEAGLLLRTDGGRLQGACYFGHIALECALKLRLLAAARAQDLNDLRRLQGALADSLFCTARGHDLARLAQAAGLMRFLQAGGRTALLDGPIWRRITKTDRPYSLRYGHERPARRQSQEEVDLAGQIVELLLEGVRL